MGKSKLGPCFFTSAGAKLMVVPPQVNLWPEFESGDDTLARFLYGCIGESDDYND